MAKGLEWPFDAKHFLDDYAFLHGKSRFHEAWF